MRLKYTGMKTNKSQKLKPTNPTIVPTKSQPKTTKNTKKIHTRLHITKFHAQLHDSNGHPPGFFHFSVTKPSRSPWMLPSNSLLSGC